MADYNKLDKLKKGEWETKFKKYEAKMLEVWEALPKVFATSSDSGKGLEELLDFVEDTNVHFKSIH